MSVITFSGHGLNNMFLPEKYRFAFTLREGKGLDDSNPRLACKYTLNTLLGLHQTKNANGTFAHSLSTMYESTCAELKTLDPQPADIAMALWAGYETELRIPAWITTSFDLGLDGFRDWHAQDISWSLYAICVAHAKGENRWDDHAHKLANFLIEELLCPNTGFYFFHRNNLRRSFSSFAVPVYVNLALAEYSSVFGNARAAETAKKGIFAMLKLQHPKTGGWAWFHDVNTGNIMDWYELYSVHQHAMAPMTLLRGIDLGIPACEAALTKGFKWIFGANELGVSMVSEKSKIIYRSFRRKNAFLERPKRLLRAQWNSLLGQSAKEISAGELEINNECRSYELGWLLWTFAGRKDFLELTQHDQFKTSSLPSRETASKMNVEEFV